jgi:hypothetical protein
VAIEPVAARNESILAQVRNYVTKERCFVRGIIDVPLRPSIIECSAIVRIKRETTTHPFRKIRIREKIPAKSDEIGIARCQDCVGAFRVETTGRDDWASEQRTKLAGRYRWLVVL